MGLSKDTVFIQALAGIRYSVAHRFLKALTEEERGAYVSAFEAASDAAPPGVFLCLLCFRQKRGATDPSAFCRCPPLQSIKNLASFYRNARPPRH